MAAQLIRIANPPELIRVIRTGNAKQPYRYMYQGRFISEKEAQRVAKKIQEQQRAMKSRPRKAAKKRRGATRKPNPGGPKMANPRVGTVRRKKNKGRGGYTHLLYTGDGPTGWRTISADEYKDRKGRKEKGKRKGKKGGKSLTYSQTYKKNVRKGKKPVKTVQLKKGKKGKYTAFKKNGGEKTGYSLVRTNPSASVGKQLIDIVKKGGALYGGLLGIRVANGLIKEYVVGTQGTSGLLKSQTDAEAFLVKAAPYIPAVATFGVSVFLLPRVVKNKDWVTIGQLAGTLGLFDTIMSNAVIPMLKDSAKDESTGAVDTSSFAYKLSTYLGLGEGPSELEGVGYYPDEGVGYYPDEMEGMGADPYAVHPRVPWGTGLFVRE